MASTLLFSLIALISILIAILPSTSFPKTPPIPGFAAPLIHRDSPQSPLYNPKATPADLREAAHRRSASRQKYIASRVSPKTRPNAGVSVPTSLDYGDYIMKYQIGSPPVETFGIFDTGSTLTWLQCEPCEVCYNQTGPLFWPTNSSSYERSTCGDPACADTLDTWCDFPEESEGLCYYNVRYEDSARSSGVIATDTIIIGNTTFHDFGFGCGYNNSDPNTEDNPPGIVGAGSSFHSLVDQIASHMFSYCISEETNTNSSVKFGSMAVIAEDKKSQIPLSIAGVQGFYTVDVEDITVDGKSINVSASVFKTKPSGGGGTVVDTGSTYTYLVHEAYEALELAVSRALSDYTPITNPERSFRLCYDPDDFQLVETPEIAFHFAPGGEFMLSAENTWKDHCLAFKPSYNGSSILGMYQQRLVDVGFNLSGGGKFVTFQYKSDCRW